MMRSNTSPAEEKPPPPDERSRPRSFTVGGEPESRDKVRLFARWLHSLLPSETGDAEGPLDERLHPLGREFGTFCGAAEAMELWIRFVLADGQIHDDDLFHAAVYVERALSRGVVLSVATARRLLLACVMLAAKVEYDSAVHAVDFLAASTAASAVAAERFLLAALEFDAFVSAAEYWELRVFILARRREKKKEGPE